MDAAIRLLARQGVAGLTHRRVDDEAQLPTGTASNYFRSREALLLGAAERLAETRLSALNMWEAPPTASCSDSAQLLTHVIGRALHEAAIVHRDQYLAMLELQLEAGRRPSLAVHLTTLQKQSIAATTRLHDQANLAIPADRVPILMTLLWGAVVQVITSTPPPNLSHLCDQLAAAVVKGGLDN